VDVLLLPFHLLRHFLSDLLQLLKRVYYFTSQYPLEYGVCSLMKLEAPTASVAMGFQ
jgi:hypothetical protein